ncbi:nicotinate-nucleotide adenylyltransferase [Mycoplasma crocodyli]|uniref:Probable nicotinate-nucleotide adenylyltransferase n=1 Tax=Mycoplasma crocodyli (strain ATCC 51981 / MP145) TaxID=512564 RepID=D5E5N7_MYCCM|nr:nicotinate-nucleotide adenylyltransferase [Mycoplasma crocodyli]ADE19635.1 probable nicotinate-nucleotide adenylyltransferase (Deamido-NAD(+) pyrophosphorylase) [Mycoplasma crocodyli MP145]
MKIAIFGGSFDPIHKGHTKIANWCINELELDKLIFIPAFKSPFKTNRNLVDQNHRIEMIKLVLPEKCEISDFELKRQGVSYTIETVKYFKNKYPNDELFLIIGSDNLPKLNKWKDIDELSKITKIAAFKRGKNINKLNLKRYNGILLNNPLFNYSSTEFKKGYLDVCDEKVIEYIGKNFLYAQELVTNMLSAKRSKHSFAAATFAAEVAKGNKLNAKISYYAALFHDIAKEWDDEEHKNFLTRFGYDTAKYGRHEYHQLCGALWLEHIYKINNQEIIKSVRYHTTTNIYEQKVATELEKIVYIADKICEGRKFEGIQKLREIALSDYKEAFKLVLKRTYDFEKSKGTIFSDVQEKTYKLNLEK